VPSLTFSIIGRDSRSQLLGAAVISHAYGFGPRVVFAEPARGIIVTQMVANPGHGLAGMPLLERGARAADVVEAVLAADPGRPVRQLAVADARGGLAVETGAGCVAAAGHTIRAQCAAQGAMVESPQVWNDAADAFEQASGSLARRLLAALRAGVAAGGDIRGHGAAVVVVASMTRRAAWLDNRPVDIRVDDHADPLAEVERHLILQERYVPMDLAFEKGAGGDLAGALHDYARLLSGEPSRRDPEVAVRHGVLLAMSGDIPAARRRLDDAYAAGEQWREVVRRLAGAAFLPNDPRIVSALVDA
jgi:uncharacterized Ntn-hydrolase superfamily protein